MNMKQLVNLKLKILIISKTKMGAYICFNYKKYIYDDVDLTQETPYMSKNKSALICKSTTKFLIMSVCMNSNNGSSLIKF